MKKNKALLYGCIVINMHSAMLLICSPNTRTILWAYHAPSLPVMFVFGVVVTTSFICALIDLKLYVNPFIKISYMFKII